MHQAIKLLMPVSCRQPRYPLQLRARRCLKLCCLHGVSPQRLVLPRALPSTDVTPLHQYYGPSDFPTTFSVSSLLRLFTDTPFPARVTGTSHVYLTTLTACRALRPRGCRTSLPITSRAMVSSGLFKPSTIPAPNLSGLNHFNLSAYGLHPLCLRLTCLVAKTGPRRDTEYAGSALLRRYFQPPVVRHLVAHK